MIVRSSSVVLAGSLLLSACSGASSAVPAAMGSLGGGTMNIPASSGTVVGNPGNVNTTSGPTNNNVGMTAPLPASQPANAGEQVASASNARAQSVSNPYPFAQGDSFQYAYVGSHSSKPANKPLSKTSTTGTIATTIGGTVTFDGQQLTDVKSVFAYKSADPEHNLTTTGTTTTDQYETFAQAGNGLNYETYGGVIAGNSSNSNGETSTNNSTTTYGGPFILDELPEVKGAQWNEPIAYTLNAQSQTTKGGTTTNGQSTYTRNADGSYTRTVTRTTTGKPTYNEQESQSANGSGQDVNNGTGPDSGTTTFAAPAQGSGGYTISVVHTPISGPPTTTLVPDWFPGSAAAPPLVTDQRQDIGHASVPTKCGPTAGQAAQELRETLTSLDVVAGSYSTEVFDTYVVAGEGTVCIDHQRIVNVYDNRATGALISVDRFNDTTGLISESTGQAKTKR